MSDIIKRKELKAKGWRRRSRTHRGIHIELWQPPWNGIGYQRLAMSLEKAYKEMKA